MVGTRRTVRGKNEPPSERTTNARPQSGVAQLDLLEHQSPQPSQTKNFTASPSNELPSSGDTIADPNLHTVNSSACVHPHQSHGASERMATEETLNSRTTPVESSATASPNEVKEPDQLSKIGHSSRQLIKVIQKLDALKIDTTLQSLPKFVVVGDQSAGKSSIIEAACEIALPRSQGTCTRCPFQITTSASNHNAPWKCTVSLHHRYQYDSRSRASKTSPYPRWIEQDLDIQPFATTSDKAELNTILFRAQLAILNPDKNPQSFLTRDVPNDSGRNKVDFAPNIIALEIEGPDLPELSFFDLPGAINVSEHDNEQYLVTMVEKLIVHYLEDEKALVLLACAANQDIETSTAFRFVRQTNAVRRSMGVLTKPDLMDVDRNRVDNIRRTLQGDKFPLGKSWYVTKQLSQEELDSSVPISHAQARERESQFFATTDPWKTNGALGSFADRFGIPRLQNAISNKLTAHIVESLPEIQARVHERIEEIESQLADFPEQVSQPSNAVFADIRRVHDAVVEHLMGTGLENKFQSAYKAILAGARVCIVDGKPEFPLGTPGFASHIETIDSENDEREDSIMPSTPTPSAPKKRKLDDTTAQRTPAAVATLRTPCKAQSPTPITNISKVVFELENVKARYESGATFGLHQLNPKVTEHFAMKALAGMPEVVKALLKRLQKLCEEMLTKSVETALRTRRRTQLFASAMDVVHEYFASLMQEQKYHAEQTVAAEMNRPLTIQGLPVDARKKILRRKRQEHRMAEFWDMRHAKGLKPLSEAERQKKEADPAFVDQALGVDEYGEEIDAMAKVLSYYDVASLRMLDSIVVRLDYGLLYAMNTNLQQKLIEGLHAHDNAYCAELLAEDPERLRLRRSLIAEKEKLMKAVEELDALPTSFDV